MIKDLLNLPFWQTEFYSNSLKSYLIFALVSFALILLIIAFKKLIIARLSKLVKRTSTRIDDTIIKAFYTIKPYSYAYVSLFIGSRYLAIDPAIDKVLTGVLAIVLVYQGIRMINVFVNYFVQKSIEGKADDPGAKAAIVATKMLVQILIWSIGFILILDNLGVDVTSLVAGLGISGIAVALAVQNILSDLFSSFAIYFDKPFVVGDLIRYGEIIGYVEKIGLKTTRIRSLHGEQVVVSNQELTNAVVKNLRAMQKRRVITTIGVSYETSIAKLKKIPKLIESIFDGMENVTFGRVHLMNLNESSIDYELVYHVGSRDFGMYADVNQKVLFAVLEALEKEGIEIPFPSQTVYSKEG